MKTHVLQVDSARPEPANLAQAARLIDDGNLVAIPTETVYGIAARTEKETLEKLSQLKNRQPDKTFFNSPSEPAKQLVEPIRAKTAIKKDRHMPSPAVV